MTPKEFVIWLRGFAAAANNFTLTPAQWDNVREKLEEVDTTDSNIKATRYLLDSYNLNTTAQITNNPDTLL